MHFHPGDTLVFSLPQEISVDKEALACRFSFEQAKRCEYNPIDHSITIHDLSTQPAETLTIDGLINPKSTKPLSQFSFNLRDS